MIHILRPLYWVGCLGYLTTGAFVIFVALTYLAELSLWAVAVVTAGGVAYLVQSVGRGVANSVGNQQKWDRFRPERSRA